MADFGNPNTDHPPPTYQQAIDDTPLAENNVEDNGRIDVDLDSRLSRALYRVVKPPPSYNSLNKGSSISHAGFPIRLNVVIQVVGSRGDVQPFLALGKELQDHGHRVRLATHHRFRAFVQDSGLMFFDIGGDPEDLMAYMVKNPGLIPSMKSLRAGDIARKREMVAEMLDGCWRSCVESDPDTTEPFVADAIIANPPSFAHVHCAEALGIPVQMMFTMPWSGTAAFAHPLANVKGSTSDPKLANYMTYVLVEWLTWQGLGDVINAFRGRLDLESVPVTEGPMLAETLKIPHTYCWSPALVPKPADWAAHINVAGFFFRKMPDYKPPEELQAFLEAGTPPIYIGFGSIVLEDTERFSSAIVEAVTQCGERAIISPGWSRLLVPKDRPDLFCLEECPHEWLFQHVSMVVHHGGAGTTAIGLREARPTIIVPFFGDQPFWGNMVAASGAGPTPLPQKQVTPEKLAKAIKFCRGKEVQGAAASLAEQIRKEGGVKAAVGAFHTNLPPSAMQCDILSDQPACWHLKLGGKQVKISKPAAEVLVRDTGFNAKNLKSYRSKPIVITNRRWDPATGVFSSLIGTSVDIADGATGIFLKPGQEIARGRSRPPTPKSRSEPGSASTSTVRPHAVIVTEMDDSRELSSDEAAVSAAKSLNSIDAISTHSSSGSETRNNYKAAGSVALASGKSLGKTVGSFYKGVIVDLPLATAEGFRALPRLWGGEVKHYGDVTDWQSGGLVAGKTLVQGMGNGFRDVVAHPVNGARDGGALGAARGVATGVGSLVSGTVSAGVGLVAYPGHGLMKSLHTWTHSGTGNRVAQARHAEGSWSSGKLTERERLAIVDAYHDLQRGKT